MFLKTDITKITAYKILSHITDHYPLMISLGATKPHKANKKYYTYLDYRKLRQEAIKLSWNSILENSDPNSALDLLINNIQTAIKTSTVSKKYKKKTNREVIG